MIGHFMDGSVIRYRETLSESNGVTGTDEKTYKARVRKDKRTVEQNGKMVKANYKILIPFTADIKGGDFIKIGGPTGKRIPVVDVLEAKGMSKGSFKRVIVNGHEI